jgi:aspartyl-tRNA(Asn)/glutamyl-tRNA(Gln) amidotransferase subunit A
MTAGDLDGLTLVKAVTAIRAGRLSPVDLTDHFLDRIARLNPTLNAFITVTTDQARAAARTAGDGSALDGPLPGVPLAVKDLFDTVGVRTTAGSTILADRIPARDATVVARLRAAGAVLLGKLNMHEFAYGVSSINPHYGDCRNPWDIARISGGSSGGSAVAVAAGLCLGSLGTDTGGSIRIPASLCGIVGLKPTYGRVSRAGVIPLAWTLDHVGPMARTVLDCALLLTVIAGHDPSDPTSDDQPAPDFRSGIEDTIRGLRVGLPERYFFDDLEPVVRTAVEAAAHVLQAQGAELRRVEIPMIELAGLTGDTIMAGEASAFHQRWLRGQPHDYGDDVRRRLMLSTLQPAAAYVNAQRLRGAIRSAFLDALREVDVLLTPATPMTAPPIAGFDVEDRIRLKRFTTPVNVAELPALVLPCGFDGGGLPIGMQLIGRPFEESTILRVGHTYERVTEWTARAPEV